MIIFGVEFTKKSIVFTVSNRKMASDVVEMTGFLNFLMVSKAFFQTLCKISQFGLMSFVGKENLSFFIKSFCIKSLLDFSDLRLKKIPFLKILSLDKWNKNYQGLLSIRGQTFGLVNSCFCQNSNRRKIKSFPPINVPSFEIDVLSTTLHIFFGTLK